MVKEFRMEKLEKPVYDLGLDVLLLKVNKKESCDSSLDFGDLIVDLNRKKEPIAFEFLNFSKNLNVKKEVLIEILKLEFSIHIDEKKCKAKINLISKYRNKNIPNNFSYVDGLLENITSPINLNCEI